MLLEDFRKAVNQLTDPAFARVLWRALGLTIALLAAFFAAFVWGLGWLLPDTVSLPFLGEVTFVTSILSFAAVFLMLGLSVFLMVPVASVFIGVFLDDIAEAVEARHYPDLPPVEPLPWSDVLLDSLRFLGIVVVANAAALIVYLLSTVFAPFVFWAVNGFLLGREYFQLVASRRIGRRAADDLRKRHLGRIWTAGVLMAVPLTVPLVNLVVPILGVAVFTHLFHRLNRA